MHYVPDACKYVEVKPLKCSQEEQHQTLFSSFEASFENPNMSFLLLDEMEVSHQPLLSNYEKLYQYRKRLTLDMRNLYQFAKNVGNAMPESLPTHNDFMQAKQQLSLFRK
ncbi:hypothetical protein [Microbulbifer epialgicus]|uniref:Uncharacterized protein n=1 Tax=Microbulbifer epialgicus TaxID=393907 RepID=A0ABV4P664_9GAMM